MSTLECDNITPHGTESMERCRTKFSCYDDTVCELVLENTGTGSRRIPSHNPLIKKTLRKRPKGRGRATGRVLTVSRNMETNLSEASRISSTDSAGFRTLQRTIAEVYRGTVVAPGLSVVVTDSRHYAPIASDIYRFLPLRVTADDLKRIHGVDERIGIKTYADLIGFLARLIENLSTPEAMNAPERPSVR